MNQGLHVAQLTTRQVKEGPVRAAGVSEYRLFDYLKEVVFTFNAVVRHDLARLRDRDWIPEQTADIESRSSMKFDVPLKPLSRLPRSSDGSTSLIWSPHRTRSNQILP